MPNLTKLRRRQVPRSQVIERRRTLGVPIRSSALPVTLCLRCEWCKELFYWTGRWAYELQNRPRTCKPEHMGKLRVYERDRKRFGPATIASPIRELLSLSPYDLASVGEAYRERAASRALN